MVSGLDKGRLCSTGATGAGRNGTFGAFLRGEKSSLAVHVDVSKIGDEIIGRGCAPGFNGGKAGGTSNSFSEHKTFGTGGAGRIGSPSCCFRGAIENPLKFPKKSFLKPARADASSCKRE